jgi:hypothetical protein
VYFFFKFSIEQPYFLVFTWCGEFDDRVAHPGSSLCFQTSSEAHPASYPMGPGGTFPGGKARPGRDANHSPPSRAEIKMRKSSHLSHLVPAQRVLWQVFTQNKRWSSACSTAVLEEAIFAQPIVTLHLIKWQFFKKWDATNFLGVLVQYLNSIYVSIAF